MRIIIAGLSYTGRTLVKLLKNEGHSLTVIDTSRAAVESAEKEFGVEGVIGSAAKSETLSAANADAAELFIAATNSDELNILSCLGAKKAGAGHTMAVSHDPELLPELPYFETIGNIDLIFNPEYETASVIYRSISIPAAVNVSGFASGHAELAHVELPDGADVIGKSLAALRVSKKLSVLVCAVERGGKVMIPDGRFVLENGDKIFITGPHSELYSFIKTAGLPCEKIKKVMIIGGSNISLFLAARLERSGVAVKIIEKDRAVCEKLRETLKKTQVVCGDPFDGSLLVEEGLSSTDAVMALSEKNEENVIVAMYAKQTGAKKIITRVSKSPLEQMLPDLGYNSSIVSREKTLTRIALTYVRALADRSGSSVGSVFRIAHGGAEVVEFIAGDGFKHAGVPLMRLDIREGVLIAGIVHGKDLLYPNGSTSIMDGDRVIIVSSSPLKSLNDIIK